MATEIQRQRSRRWYEEHKPGVLARTSARGKTSAAKEWQRKYRREPANWPRLEAHALRAKAKRLNIPFDLTPADIVVPTLCPFTRLPFDFSSDKRGVASAQSPSVDRIKPDKGYVRGNVRVISLQANVAKSNITDPEIFRRLYEDARLWALA